MVTVTDDNSEPESNHEQFLFKRASVAEEQHHEGSQYGTSTRNAKLKTKKRNSSHKCDTLVKISMNLKDIRLSEQARSHILAKHAAKPFISGVD